MLALTGGKGGSGKTTTALGLARALARDGASPLVVDTDTDMPDLHHFAGLSRDPSMDQLSADTQLTDVTRQSDRFPGVSLLTAGSRSTVRQALRRAQQWQGPVLVDCPPGLGSGAIGPVRVASGALVVTTEQPTCLEDARQTIRALRQVDTDPTGVLLVSQSRTKPPRAVAGCRVLGTTPFSKSPFEDDRVSETWHRVAKTIWRGQSPAGQPATPTPADPVSEQITQP